MKEFYNISKITFSIFFVAVVLIGLYGIYTVNPEPAEILDTISEDIKSEEGLKESALVERVVDGDTFVIKGGQSVRILGIDADEKGSLCYDVAKLRLEDAIGDQAVELEVGPKNEDVYGRLLRYVFIGDENISATLVKEGLVIAEAPYEGGRYDQEISDVESYAKLNKIGCKWAN